MESLWNAMKGSHYKRTIEQLARSIRETRNLDDALRSAMEMVLAAVHAETGTFWFYERFRDGRIYPKALKDNDTLAGVSLLPGEGIAGQVIQTGKSTIIQNCQADPRWAGRVDKKTGFQTRTMICVPMALEESVFGCIQIINKTDGISFDEKDLSFAERLASEITLLLKHQNLLEDYIASPRGGDRPEKAEVSFRAVFCAESEREMEYLLRNIKEFSGLRYGEQQAVLRLAREMRGYFTKKR